MFYYYINDSGKFSITHTQNEQSFLEKSERLGYKLVIKSPTRLTPDLCLLKGRVINMSDSRDIDNWISKQNCWSVHDYFGYPRLVLDFFRCQEAYHDDIVDKLQHTKDYLQIPSARAKISEKLGIEESKTMSIIREEIDKLDLDCIWTTKSFPELESINYPVLDVISYN